jgi:predicted RND superfamily exporter protein
LILRYLRWAQRWRWAIIAVALAVFGLCSFISSKLELRTALSELLPSDDPGVVTLEKTQARLGDMSLLLIGVSSPDREANLRYAEVVTQRLRKLPPSTLAFAAYHVRDMRAFLDDNRWLYLKQDSLEAIRDRLKREIVKKKNPMFVDLGGDDESLDDLRKRVTPKDALQGKFEGGYFTQGTGEYVWIAALPPGGMFTAGAGESLLKAAQAIIDAEPPTKYHPAMRAHVGGPIATGLANRKAMLNDIFWVSVTCLSLVVVSIGLFFRQVRPVILVGIPSLLGASLAFAFAELVYGHLNMSTAFLGSIMVGNGINYGIVFIARYEEEKAAGQPLFQALVTAVSGVWRGTLVAALSAAAAYGALVVTSFRGFSQFGVIGGAGWLFCWASTFLVLPALVLALDGTKLGRTGPRPPARLGALARLVSRRADRVLAGSAVLSVLALLGARHFVHDPFEYDFRKLGMKPSASAESEKFDRNLNDLFGRWPSPTIVLADSIEDSEKLKAAIRRQDAAAPGGPVIGQVTTIFDLLPGTPQEQYQRLALIQQIRKLTHDPALELADDKEKKQLADATPPDGLHVLQPQDLPPLARRPFTEADGTIGRVVLVYPVEKGLSVWNGRDLLRIASVLQNLTLDDGRVVPTSGSAVIFGAMIRSILRDGPIATLAALLTVVLIVVSTMRPVRYAFYALIALVVGVVWMVGAAGAAGVKITFLNFIALPITLGLGIEYAVNVLSRYREDEDVVAAVSSTGGAVALCSWTTIVGYGSLLAAQNLALRGFGAMAILSEVSCLSAAVVTLPALLTVLKRRQARRM